MSDKLALLGFLGEEVEKNYKMDCFCGKYGGMPIWPFLEMNGEEDKIKCSKCGKILLLAFQFDATIEENETGYKLFYLFVCNNCESNPDWKFFRIQVNGYEENLVYNYYEEEEYKFETKEIQKEEKDIFSVDCWSSIEQNSVFDSNSNGIGWSFEESNLKNTFQENVPKNISKDNKKKPVENEFSFDFGSNQKKSENNLKNNKQNSDNENNENEFSWDFDDKKSTNNSVDLSNNKKKKKKKKKKKNNLNELNSNINNNQINLNINNNQINSNINSNQINLNINSNQINLSSANERTETNSENTIQVNNLKNENSDKISENELNTSNDSHEKEKEVKESLKTPPKNKKKKKKKKNKNLNKPFIQKNIATTHFKAYWIDWQEENETKESKIDSKPVEKYNQLKLGKNEVYENESYESSFKNQSDIIFHKFYKRIFPEQILRFCKNSPIWMSVFQPKTVPNCENCGSKRIFQLQLLPSFIFLIGDNKGLGNFGTIALFSCSKNCFPKQNNSYLSEEYCFVQHSPF